MNYKLGKDYGYPYYVTTENEVISLPWYCKPGPGYVEKELSATATHYADSFICSSLIEWEMAEALWAFEQGLS